MSSSRLVRLLSLIAGLLVIKVTGTVSLGYVNYFPPNFDSEFLRGRQDYFFGSYWWAFYPHIIAGPICLCLGVLLLNARIRTRWPTWHRRLGRLQGLLVLLVIAPSGLWMSAYSEAGPIAGLGFAGLALFIALSTLLGWRAAVKRRFADHRRWMWRCFLALCSAVVLRLTVGIVIMTGATIPWFDPLVGWFSWLLPLLVFEMITYPNRSRRKTVWKEMRKTAAPVGDG